MLRSNAAAIDVDDDKENVAPSSSSSSSSSSLGLSPSLRRKQPTEFAGVASPSRRPALASIRDDISDVGGADRIAARARVPVSISSYNEDALLEARETSNAWATLACPSVLEAILQRERGHLNKDYMMNIDGIIAFQAQNTGLSPGAFLSWICSTPVCPSAYVRYLANNAFHNETFASWLLKKYRHDDTVSLIDSSGVSNDEQLRLRVPLLESELDFYVGKLRLVTVAGEALGMNAGDVERRRLEMLDSSTQWTLRKLGARINYMLSVRFDRTYEGNRSQGSSSTAQVFYCGETTRPKKRVEEHVANIFDGRNTSDASSKQYFYRHIGANAASKASIQIESYLLVGILTPTVYKRCAESFVKFFRGVHAREPKLEEVAHALSSIGFFREVIDTIVFDSYARSGQNFQGGNESVPGVHREVSKHLSGKAAHAHKSLARLEKRLDVLIQRGHADLLKTEISSGTSPQNAICSIDMDYIRSCVSTSERWTEQAKVRVAAVGKRGKQISSLRGKEISKVLTGKMKPKTKEFYEYVITVPGSSDLESASEYILTGLVHASDKRLVQIEASGTDGALRQISASRTVEGFAVNVLEIEREKYLKMCNAKVLKFPIDFGFEEGSSRAQPRKAFSLSGVLQHAAYQGVITVHASKKQNAISNKTRRRTRLQDYDMSDEQLREFRENVTKSLRTLDE